MNSMSGSMQTSLKCNLCFILGARTDTTEKDRSIFDELNLRYSQDVWKRCVRYGLPLVYASSLPPMAVGNWATKIRTNWSTNSNRSIPMAIQKTTLIVGP